MKYLCLTWAVLSAASIPTGFPAASLQAASTGNGNAQAQGDAATAAESVPAPTSDASAAGKTKEGESSNLPVSVVGSPPAPNAVTGGDGQAAPPPVATMVQIQTPNGDTPASIPPQAYLVAPPNFAASIGAAPGQNITITLPPGPQARVSNDPNNAFFTLDLTEDNTDLPLPLEEEGKWSYLCWNVSFRRGAIIMYSRIHILIVDLSSYSYKINLGKDVVSGKGKC